MDAFHERLARIAPAELEAYGFCLAGGYAVHAHGLVERPSEDIDLFTSRAHIAEFPQAVQTAVRVFEANGLSVNTELATDEFARLWVADTSERSKVELGVDWLAHPPMQLSIGPVLHVEDAIANKVCALFSRAQVRDFIDVDAITTRSQFAPEDPSPAGRRSRPGLRRHVLRSRAAPGRPVRRFRICRLRAHPRANGFLACLGTSVGRGAQRGVSVSAIAEMRRPRGGCSIWSRDHAVIAPRPPERPADAGSGPWRTKLRLPMSLP